MMKTLLIVEDEKAIRAGIHAMVSRAPVPVENILECRNGEDALEILRSRHVDAMITDIRMPKMDGVELIRRARQLPSPPITIVVSGYGDFNYAVSAFRDGVRDYILKPIERERISALLSAIQEELDAGSREQTSRITMDRHALRSLMLGSQTSPEELRALSAHYSGDLFEGSYVSICVAPRSGFDTGEYSELESGFYLADVEEHTVLLVPEGSLASLKQECIDGRCAGVSSAKRGLAQLRDAYMEAALARKRAFIRGCHQSYADIPAKAPKAGDALATPDRIVQALGAGNACEAIRQLEQMLFHAQNGLISPEDHIALMERTQVGVISAYAHIPDALEEYRALKDILSYENAYEHYKALCGWLERLSGYLADGLENLNKKKIRTSVEYVNERYRSDINMATASNHISMNYTQFSTLFKEYTGSSFPEYLLNVRLAESKRLLADASLSIGSAGKSSGFRNEKHFMRCFKRAVGVSPSEYRRNLQVYKTE